jgi:hypothetical protein
LKSLPDQRRQHFLQTRPEHDSDTVTRDIDKVRQRIGFVDASPPRRAERLPFDTEPI